MPRRPSINAISPHSSSNALNEVIGALSRKLTSSQHLESTAISPPTSRRGSFKMDQLLGKKEKKQRSDSKERETRKEKRGSAILRPKSKDRTASERNSHTSPALRPHVGGKFEMIMESPPTILHGSTTYSSGALLSGRLKLNVEDPAGELTLTSFGMVLRVNTSTKKPVSKECKECTVRHEIVREWKFLSEPKTFQKMQDNQFPWSHLLDGKLPATTNCLLGSIGYEFLVTAKTSSGETLTFTHPMNVQRAIPPGPDKASIRIFPPTHLTGRVTMPPIIHPIGKFPVTMTLSGVVEKKAQSQTRWRLKKMMWRIEEHSKVKSTPCEKHKGKVTEGKAVQHTDSRQLGNDEMKSGWKTDFDTAGGEITLEFEASLATKPSHKPTCDVDSQSGLEVKHNLVIELIVAEEFVPNKNTNLITPTGAARVLRMQFALIVTERAGMGISWDDEQPPMYEDVPPSPPHYGNADKQLGSTAGAVMEEYRGPSFEYEDLERVQTSNPADPPMYRERDVTELNAGLPLRAYGGATELDDVPEASTTRQRLAGFRLDELEAEPQFRRRAPSEDATEQEVDFGEGMSGAAAAAREQPRR